MRALDNGGTEALLAAPFAFPAKLVVLLPTTFIKKECPLSLEVLRHTGHTHHLLARMQWAVFGGKIKNAQDAPK